MKRDHTVTVVYGIVGMIVIGACAYLGYMIADTELTSTQRSTTETPTNNMNHTTSTIAVSNDTQRNSKIFSAVSGGLVGLGVVGVIYWIIQRKEEHITLKTGHKVLSRFSRYAKE